MKMKNMKDFCISIQGRFIMESSLMDRKMGMEFKYFLMRRLSIRGILSMEKKLVNSMSETIKHERNI